MTPGAYLAKRRAAAGVSIEAAAVALACDPRALRPAGPADVIRLKERLHAIEADRDALSAGHAGLLRRVFAFDFWVYSELLWGGTPQLCRACGCSWMDPCIDDHGACAWSDHHDDLCTACERVAAAEAELAPRGAIAPGKELRP